MTAPALEIDRRSFRVLLTDGQRVNCTAIEREPDGSLFVRSTLGERFPSARVLKVDA